MLVYRTVLFLMLVLCNQYGIRLADASEGTRSVSETILKTEDILQAEADRLYGKVPYEEGVLTKQEVLTEQEALDRVKAKYATNFSKVIREDGESYFYQLDIADYYLVSEGLEGEHNYLIHLYEFVVDEDDSGLGHTVTYGWYAVDRRTGEIEERMVY